MFQLDRRALTFGCVGAVIGIAIVGAAWAIVSTQREPEPAWRHSVAYDRCLATGRTTTACDADVRVLKAEIERARKENPFAFYGEVAPDREKARRDSERACLEQSGIPDYPVAKLACAPQ